MTIKKKVAFATYLDHLIKASDHTQREIADALGYEHSNIISMFKKGKTKVPVTKIPDLARVLGANPVHMLRLALREYHPEVLRTIEDAAGGILTENEVAIIEIVRDASKGSDPRPDADIEKELRKVFE